MGWTIHKPTEPCVFVAATKTNGGKYIYHTYELDWIKDSSDNSLVLFDGDQYEWGDLEDFEADKYLILPKH